MKTTCKLVAGTLIYETIKHKNDSTIILKTRREFNRLTSTAIIKQNNKQIIKHICNTMPNNFNKQTIEQQHFSININSI